MGCCDSSTQFGRNGGVFGVGAGVVEGDAAGGEGIGLTSAVAGRAEGTSAAEAAVRCGESDVVAEATTHKADRIVTPTESAARRGGSAELSAGGAGNSFGTRNVLEIADLRTMNSSTTEQGSAARWLLLLFVRFYQIFFSPFLGGACKFYPSCSRYAQEAIEMHGARRGAWLAMKRLGRCRPFTKGGFDPVPENVEKPDVVAEFGGANKDSARGTSGAEAAACVGEDYVVAEATTHKANSRAWVDYRDADWLRTVGKERAQ
ncbi:MAG: membrane protein insertion efficiency factor YidD [Candidatus Acidiferrales bacterium]